MTKDINMKESADSIEETKQEESFFDIVKMVLTAFTIAMVLRIFIFQPFSIPSESMRPGLVVGDYLFVSKWNYGFSNASIPFEPKIIKGRIFNKQLNRGDVVVFKLPRDGKTDYIKRVVGLPGDRIQVIGGQLIINGTPVPRKAMSPQVIVESNGTTKSTNIWRETLPNGKSYNVYDFDEQGDLDNTEVYEVPPEHYFMMGDNRDNSLDSRVPMINDPPGVGYVPAENIVGKAQIIMFSWRDGASLWKPWTWFLNFRLNRLFVPIK